MSTPKPSRRSRGQKKAAPEAKSSSKPVETKQEVAKTVEVAKSPDVPVYDAKRVGAALKAGKDSAIHDKVVERFTATLEGLVEKDKGRVRSQFTQLMRLFGAAQAATFGLYYVPMLNFIHNDITKWGEQSVFHGEFLLETFVDEPAWSPLVATMLKLAPKKGRSERAKSFNPAIVAAGLPATHHSVITQVK